MPGFLGENPAGGLARRPFMAWASQYRKSVHLCRTRYPGTGGPPKPSDITSSGLVPELKCGVKLKGGGGRSPQCDTAAMHGVHLETLGGRKSRPAWELTNLGVGEPVMEGVMARLRDEKRRRRRCRGGGERRRLSKLWVLELYCAMGANKPAAARLGLGHVAVGGCVEGGGKFTPDVNADVALVFKEHHDPLNFLVSLALSHLGSGYDADGLILITAAPRCTTYSSMRRTNDARGAHTYRLANGNPKPGRIGLPARVDDAANQRMFYFLCRHCGVIP